MLDWLKNINKEHPEWWKNYISKFDEKSSRFVVLSTETTGLNSDKDVILSIGAFGVNGDSIYIGDSFEVVLLQYIYLHDNKLSSDFLLETKLKKLSDPDTIELLIEFIGSSVIVGHHIDFDVEIINAALERLDCGRLKNEALDIDVMHRKLLDINDKQFSLDELCKIYNIPISDRTSSAEDAYKSALLFLKLKSKLRIK